MNLSSNFFKRKVESLKKTIEKHKFLTVFELYVLEVFNEVVQNLKHVPPLDLLMKIDNRCTYATRRTEKGLLPIEFSRTKIKSTSNEKIFRKGYTLKKEFDLIRENLNDSSLQQVKNWFKKTSDNFIGGTTLRRLFHPE